MGDVEVGNVSIIKRVPFRGPLECLFIMKDTFLKHLDLFREVMILYCGVGLMVGNGREESVRNGAKELSINVGISGKGGLSRSWGHCQCGWSR